MENPEFEQSKVFIVRDLLDYIPNSVAIKTIVKKITGNVTAIAVDGGEGLHATVSSFDTFIQVVEGNAVLIIGDLSYQLDAGEAFIIPAHTRNTIRSNVRFKLLSTVIKAGYEAVV